MTKKNKKMVGLLMRALLVGVLLGGPVQMTHAVSGVPSGSNAAIADRTVATDGNGKALSGESGGWKVFITSATSAVTSATNEDGTTLLCAGVLHRVCTSAGAATSETFMVFDSSASAMTPVLDANNGVRSLAEPLNRATATERCLEIDAQFQRGLVLLTSVATGSSRVYYRCNGSAK